MVSGQVSPRLLGPWAHPVDRLLRFMPPTAAALYFLLGRKSAFPIPGTFVMSAIRQDCFRRSRDRDADDAEMISGGVRSDQGVCRDYPAVLGESSCSIEPAAFTKFCMASDSCDIGFGHSTGDSRPFNFV
jgi:hypothetical protein